LEGWSFTIKLCPHEPNGKKGCHEVAGSQAVFCWEMRGLKLSVMSFRAFPLVLPVETF
jgi:hypothetical protein